MAERNVWTVDFYSAEILNSPVLVSLRTCRQPFLLLLIPPLPHSFYCSQHAQASSTRVLIKHTVDLHFCSDLPRLLNLQALLVGTPSLTFAMCSEGMLLTKQYSSFSFLPSFLPSFSVREARNPLQRTTFITPASRVRTRSISPSLTPSPDRERETRIRK